MESCSKCPLGEDVIVIPWNRVKQIHVINKKNESEEN